MPRLKGNPSYFLFLDERVPVDAFWQLKGKVAQQHCQHGAQLCHGQGLADAVPGTAAERVPAAVDATAVAFRSSFRICYRQNNEMKVTNPGRVSQSKLSRKCQLMPHSEALRASQPSR